MQLEIGPVISYRCLANVRLPVVQLCLFYPIIVVSIRLLCSILHFPVRHMAGLLASARLSCYSFVFPRCLLRLLCIQIQSVRLATSPFLLTSSQRVNVPRSLVPSLRSYLCTYAALRSMFPISYHPTQFSVAFIRTVYAEDIE